MAIPRNDIKTYCDFVNPLITPNLLNPANTNPTYSNQLIGAIANPTEFGDFKTSFCERVSILYNEYKDSPENLKVFLNLLENLATDTWGGFYSELTAYYVLLRSGLFPINLDQTLPASVSYAGDVKGKETNEDFHCTYLDFYGDVKRFTDVNNEILHKIIMEVTDETKQTTGVDINILPEYPLAIPEEEFSRQRKQIKQELTEMVKFMETSKIEKKSFGSSIINYLRYNIRSGGGVNQAVRLYNPYERAERLKDMVLRRYTRKIMKNCPFFLVFVNFPWDNPTDRDSFGSNKLLYRALARRTFMQYRHSQEEAKDIIPKYTGTDSLFEISKCISGLVFIDDHAIKNKEYSSYVYLNPNAKNLTFPLRSHLGEMLTQHPADNSSEFDEMEHDNY